jgi:hypothetical protein
MSMPVGSPAMLRMLGCLRQVITRAPSSGTLIRKKLMLRQVRASRMPEFLPQAAVLAVKGSARQEEAPDTAGLWFGGREGGYSNLPDFGGGGNRQRC